MRTARTFTRSTPRGVSDKINSYAEAKGFTIISFAIMPCNIDGDDVFVGCVVYEDNIGGVAKHESGV